MTERRTKGGIFMNQQTFLISDTHFSHRNILSYENRPFQDTEEMDERMISRWNETVQPEDLVFHLGDVIIAGAARAEELLPRLNGRKILITGNHDHFSRTKWRKLGFEPYDRYFYRDYLLTHIPVAHTPLKTAVLNGMIKGNIHGHTHSKNSHLDQSLYHCCCVELTDYRPVLFEDFCSRKKARGIPPRLVDRIIRILRPTV